MPKQPDGNVNCINHPIRMTRNEGYYAVTLVGKNGANVNFNPGTGVPSVVYFCPACGYIELYAAASDPEWQRA